LLVGIHRNFISRVSGREGLEKIVHFLETADRFHGAWPHWWNGETGKVKPFGKKDNGGDLVETSYMLQGLLCVRQFFKDGNEKEKKLVPSFLLITMGVILIGIGTARYFNLIH